MKRIFLTERLADFFADWANVPEIQLAIAHAGGAYAQNGYLGFENGSFRVGGGVQPASFVRLGDKIGYGRLHNRAATRIERLYLGWAKINSRDLVSAIREARRCHCT